MLDRKTQRIKAKLIKKQLVIDTLAKVFIYNDQEQYLVPSLIDYLFNNSKI